MNYTKLIAALMTVLLFTLEGLAEGYDKYVRPYEVNGKTEFQKCDPKQVPDKAIKKAMALANKDAGVSLDRHYCEVTKISAQYIRIEYVDTDQLPASAKDRRVGGHGGFVIEIKDGKSLGKAYSQ